MTERISYSEVKIGSDRGFGFVFASAFAAIALWPLIGGETVRLWALAVAAAFLVAALLRPAILRPLNRVWFRLGLLIGRVVSPVVMAVLFFVAVTPTALVMRALGKDVLRLKFDANAESYWIPRGDDHPMGSMKNQF
jgi:hypothetical protein